MLNQRPANRTNFKLIAQDRESHARAATFETSHGTITTPIFMPVATQAVLRSINTQLCKNIGYQVLLANTYHLLLRPGLEIFKQFGGIHRFMQWPHAVLTDSGGFQIFSLQRHLKISEEGASFRSYVDGQEINLSPELSIEAQRAINSDIMMVLDHCISSKCDYATAKTALELTTRWAKRSLVARGDSKQALFGIVQGACFPNLRKESVNQICSIPFDGYALGGLAVGESKTEREDIVELTAPLLPIDRPRYLMGVGTPIDLLEAVKRGVDMFDCIIPTAFARQGVCFTSQGKIDLSRGAYKTSENSLDPECSCTTCKLYSRAYLNHLVKAREYVVDQLLAHHNLQFYHDLMTRIRESIIAGTFSTLYRLESKRLLLKDDEKPLHPPSHKHKVNRNKLGNYEMLIDQFGYGRIKQTSSGEIMHSVLTPQSEALELYVKQSGLLEKLAIEQDPLIVWDVGLGAATNVMTCIQEVLLSKQNVRKLHIYSFECDLDPLKLALRHAGFFKHLCHKAPHAIIENGVWESDDGKIAWRLILGDFLETMNLAPAPEIIWFDPFSYKVDTKLWKHDTFVKLIEVCGGAQSALFTYSASTAVRATMLCAGWYVGVGVRTGPKDETTVAYNKAAHDNNLSRNLLTKLWLDKWSRSDAKCPLAENGEELIHNIKLHPQFAV